jgi:hypothetical protein
MGKPQKNSSQVVADVIDNNRELAKFIKNLCPDHKTVFERKCVLEVNNKYIIHTTKTRGCVSYIIRKWLPVLNKYSAAVKINPDYKKINSVLSKVKKCGKDKSISKLFIDKLSKDDRFIRSVQRDKERMAAISEY